MLNDSVHQYLYDATNQLTTVKDENGNTLGTYQYDYNGERVSKVTSDKTENYVYEGNALKFITDANNKLEYEFVRDGNGQLATMIDYTGTTPKNYFYELNQRGDVLALVDSTMHQVAEYTYDSYGNITSETGSGLTGSGKSLCKENLFRYASYFYDEETKLYYLNARYYDPNTGKFLTRYSIYNKVFLRLIHYFN